ncbi:uncharacterized protein [Dendrobates tinctorius]|uniref:uncharacterized protein isoform X2 n=1 Tax=Dendrobates tinctorius TaxID=92724 RepID=UPI003CCA2992
MDEILKSEIFVVVHGKTEGVSFEEFGGLFRQVHGYYLKLSNYGYTSMRDLLNDMNDLVEVKTINKQPMIRCKSPSRHHVVVSNVNILPQEKEQVSGRPTVLLPSSGSSPGPVKKTDQAKPTPLLQQKAGKVKTTHPATNKKSKETLKSRYCQSAKPPSPAVKHKNSPQPGSSPHGKTAKSYRFPVNHKPPIAKPVPAENLSKIKPQNSTFLKPKTSTKMPHSPYASSAMQNKKTGLLPTPGTSLLSSPFYINYMPMVAQPGIKPDVSYASACKSNLNMNKFNHGQQLPPNNVRFKVNPGVNSTSVPQSSRAEHRPSIQPTSVIKKNIQQLLIQHDSGISIFQLQKLYLTKFRQPLKFRGSVTLKHLLVEMNDVVKTEGIGVQMLVYPGSAKKNPITPANGQQDAALQRTVSLLTKGDLPREVASNQYSADSLKSQNDKLEEAAPLSFSDDHILVSGLATKNGLSQNTSENYSVPQIILHSSGFSLVMEQDMHGPHKGSEIKLSNNPDSCNGQNTSSHNNTFNGPENLQQILPNASSLIPDTKPHKSLVPQEENTESEHLQPHHSMNVMEKHGQEAVPALQPSFTFHTENNCYLSDYPALPTRGNLKTKSGLVPVVEPPSKQKSISQNRNKYEQEELANGRDVETSQDEATISPPTSDPPKTNDPYLPGSKQSVLMSSDVQKTVYTHSSQRNTENNCYTSDYSVFPTRGNLKTKSLLVPVDEPPLKQKSISQNRNQYEQEEQFKGRAVQTKNIMGRNSQDETTTSPPTIDPTKNDPYVPGTEQSVPISDVQKTVNTPSSQRKQDKPILHKKQVEDFLNPERIVYSVQETPMQQEASVEQSKPQNNLEMTPEQEETLTWQTSDRQVCCIL